MEESLPSQFFQRLIYRIYYRNSAVAHFFTHRIRPAGILLIISLPAAWMVLPQFDIAALFQLRCFIFVLLISSVLFTIVRRANVVATRDLPRLATANEPVHYRVTLTNKGKRTLTSSALLDMAPDNRPSFDLFTGSREPGENERNVFDRTFCYYRWEWLQHKLSLFSNKTSSPIPQLRKSQKTSIRLTLTPHKRGVILLNNLRICLPDPFGIFQRCPRVEANPDQIIVLPHRYRLTQLDLPGNARFQLGGEAASSTIGQSGDFTSIREYRPGDPIRHIHWKSWARTGKPIVKEYEDVFFPRYGLVLDTFAPAEDSDLFEEAVSVAASFAASIDTRETLLDLMFIRDEAYILSAGRGEERIDKMLEVLAGVTSEPRSDFEALQKLVLRYQDELTACICIFTGWSEQRRDTVTRLHRAGIELKIISICRNLQESQDLHQRYPSPSPVQWLRLNHIQEDLIS